MSHPSTDAILAEDVVEYVDDHIVSELQHREATTLCQSPLVHEIMKRVEQGWPEVTIYRRPDQYKGWLIEARGPEDMSKERYDRPPG
jgi:hypothetical protein